MICEFFIKIFIIEFKRIKSNNLQKISNSCKMI